LDAAAIISILNRHRVRYVIIGAFAAIAQQAPISPTRDIDVTPAEGKANLARLSAALKALQARIRTDAVPGGLPFDHDAGSIARADVWNLVCPFGEFDITFHPSGFDGGYKELSINAHRVLVGNIEVTVADLDDVIRSKEMAGRPKDIQALPALYRYRAARRRSSDPR
jgi:hypothetical protein